MKGNEKLLPKREPLSFLPLKWRELLQKLAIKDKREEVAELLWLIEEYAAGHLRYSEGETIPRVSLEGSGPPSHYPARMLVQPVPSQELQPDPSSHRE
jgi:hypothetical protein